MAQMGSVAGKVTMPPDWGQYTNQQKVDWARNYWAQNPKVTTPGTQGASLGSGYTASPMDISYEPMKTTEEIWNNMTKEQKVRAARQRFGPVTQPNTTPVVTAPGTQGPSVATSTPVPANWVTMTAEQKLQWLRDNRGWNVGGTVTAPGTRGPAIGTIPNPQEPWRALPEGTPAPAWYTALTSQTKLPSWMGPSNLPIPSAQAWRNMVPSEQAGYQGLAQTMGVYYPDLQARMRQLQPSWSTPYMTGRQVPWR